MCPVVVNPEGEQFEVSPGGGELTTSSGPFEVADAFSYGGGFYGGRPISYARIFAEQPWVAVAVTRLLTWAIRVPLKAYRRLDGENSEELGPEEAGISRAIWSPWKRGCQADLVMALLGPYLVHGNALLDVDDGAADNIRFESVDWRMVIPFRENIADPWSEILAWDQFKPGTGFKRLSADQVMHLRSWSPLGNVGISPLQQLRSTLTSETAAVEWAVNNLKQSWRPNGIVEMSDAALGLPPEDRFALYQRSKAELRATYAGTRNAGTIPVVPPGFKWSKAEQTTAVEAQLIEQRLINRNEVAAVYQLSPPMIGQLEHVKTMTGLQTLKEMAYTDSLAPPLILIEQLVNVVIRDLLRLTDQFVEFDFGAVLRGDRLSEIKAAREAVGMGLFTPNEGRGTLGRPKLKDPKADEAWMPVNNLSPMSAPPKKPKSESEPDEN